MIFVTVLFLNLRAGENQIRYPVTHPFTAREPQFVRTMGNLLMARSMKLHPLAIIFPLLLCVAAFGVRGVLVAVPMVAIVNILHDELYRKRLMPTVPDGDLERLARSALREKLADK